jgi:predicted RNA-binding protein YlxR (DUF448 family)
MNAPVRTCIACRGQASRHELVRLVEHPTEGLVVDGRGRLPGRGAWVHVNSECVARVTKQSSLLNRALRGPVQTHDLGDRVRAWVWRGVTDGLALARAGGALVVGHDALIVAIQEGGLTWVVTALDASTRTLNSLRRAANPALNFLPIPLTRDRLGHQVGVGLLSAVGVGKASSASLLNQRLQQWSELG